VSCKADTLCGPYRYSDSSGKLGREAADAFVAQNPLSLATARNKYCAQEDNREQNSGIGLPSSARDGSASSRMP